MKGARTVLAILGLFCAVLTSADATAQEKVKYGSAIKFSPLYYLPVLAAQEMGIFKKHGLDVEWVPARSGSDLQRNFAASVLNIASSTGATDIPAMARGVPTVIVANLQSVNTFGVWVPSDSKVRKPQDLKGAKIGVSRLGGAEHAYGRLVAEQLGLGDSVSFTSTGGIRESLALFTTGGIDGVVLTPNQMTDLQLKGKARELLKVTNYTPKPWLSYSITARKDFVQNKPDTVRRIVQSILEANQFIMSKKGEEWAVPKMISQSKYSPEAAKVIYGTMALNADGTIEKKAITNLTDFMVKYGLMKRDEVPPAEQIFTNQFVR